jgi:site-specific DNA recombinase
MAKESIKQIAIYGRTSSDNQKKDRTIESQLKAIRNYCEKKRWQIVDEYKDDGYSGTTLISERPGAKRLFENLAKYDAIVMTEDSRLSRTEDEEEQGRIQKALRLSGIYTAIVFENAIEDALTFGARIIRAIKMMVAAEERKKILERQKAGIERARAENRNLGRNAPYGVCWLEHIIDESAQKKEVKEWRRREQEHETLKEIFRLLKEHGTERIAQVLNKEPAKYPTRSGKIWHGETVRQILRSDFLFTGIRRDGVDTGIKLFTEDEVKVARQYLSKRRKSDNPQKRTWSCLLSKILKCECGKQMITQGYRDNGKLYSYYRCKACKVKKKGRKKATQFGMPTKKVDDSFWRTIKEPEKIQWLIQEKTFIPQSKRKGLEARLKQMNAELHSIEYDREKLKFLYIKEKDIGNEEYRSEKLKLNKKQVTLETERNRIQAQLGNPDHMMKLQAMATKEWATRLALITLLEQSKGNPAKLFDAGFKAYHLFAGREPTTEEIEKLIFELQRQFVMELAATGSTFTLSKEQVHKANINWIHFVEDKLNKGK